MGKRFEPHLQNGVNNRNSALCGTVVRIKSLPCSSTLHILAVVVITKKIATTVLDASAAKTEVLNREVIGTTHALFPKQGA